MSIVLNPATGLRDNTIYPNEPGSEAAAREQIQSVIDQVVTQSNAELPKQYVTFISRDLTIAGTQALTGIGFKPKAVIAHTVVPGAVGKMSLGYHANGSPAALSISDAYNVTPNTYGSIGSLVRISNNTTDYTDANITTYDNDGITLNWSKFGAGATGTAIIHLLLFR